MLHPYMRECNYLHNTYSVNFIKLHCSVCNKSPNKLHKMPNIESNPTESMTVNEMPNKNKIEYNRIRSNFFVIQLLRPEFCQFLQE